MRMRDKQRAISEMVEMRRSKLEKTRTRGARWRDKDREWREGNMRRTRRLETFQPVFPVLVIKV